MTTEHGMNCSVQELKEKFDAKEDFVLLDVRTDEELEIVKFPTCIHIPLHELENSIDKLDAYREKEIICTCHHGGRSAMAQRFLLSQGFTNVKNLPGGIHAYAVEIDPDYPTYS
jgi:rhodanese-related sulfurtransferase